jgi:hypothetical protein
VTQRTFILPVTAAPVVGAIPTWFENMPYKAWVTPSGTNRIQDVVPPPPYPAQKTTDDITGAGNGAGVDQVNKRMCIVYTGGHAGWWGTDGYELILTENAAPRWVRILDMVESINDDVSLLLKNSVDAGFDPEYYEEWTMLQEVDRGFGFSTQRNNGVWVGPDGTTYDRFNWPTTMVDGASRGTRPAMWKPWTISNVDDILDRPRPGHTCWSIHYSNGKMWYPITQASNNGSGRGSRVPHSVDMTFLRQYLTANGVPYRQTVGNKIPCKYYPVIPANTVVSTIGASAIDEGTGRIWFHTATGLSFFSMETAPGVEGQHRLYSAPFLSANSRWTIPPNAICPDPGRRFWVVICNIGSSLVPVDEIIVYDLEELEKPSPNMVAAVTKVLVPGLGALPWNRLRTPEEGRKGTGMVWHAPSQAFILFNCDESPRNPLAGTSVLFKLYPPLNTDGTWNKTGTWAVDQVTVPGIPTVLSTSSTAVTGSSFSRFNLIKNMGNGESLLISQANVLNPPSFMRLAGAL